MTDDDAPTYLDDSGQVRVPVEFRTWPCRRLRIAALVRHLQHEARYRGTHRR